MYARLWDEDRQTKCKREEMEAALQIERNREMLKVTFKSFIMTAPVIITLTIVDADFANYCQ
jgi:hypothetical protein